MSALSVVPEPPGHRPVWRTKQQIADHLGISVRCVDNWRARGLPFSKRGTVVRFDEIAVDAWFALDAPAESA